VYIQASRLSAREIISESHIDIYAGAVDAGNIDAPGRLCLRSDRLVAEQVEVGDVDIKATNIEILTLVCQSGCITTRHRGWQNPDGVLKVRQIISKGDLDIDVSKLRTEELVCMSAISISSSSIKGRFIDSNLDLTMRCDNLTAEHIHSQSTANIITTESLLVQELSCESNLTLWSEGSVITADRILTQEALGGKCDMLDVDLIHSRLEMELDVRELHVQTLVSDSRAVLRVAGALTAGDILCGGDLDIQCQSIAADKLLSKDTICLQVEGNALKVRELYADEIYIVCGGQPTGK
jgi:hypothetical protein